MIGNTSKATDRYRWTFHYVDDFVSPGRLRNGLWRPMQFASRPELDLPSGQYQIYTVTDKDIARLDFLAWQFYSDVSFWWILAYVNGIRDPLTDITSGMTLKIPNKAFVDALAEAMT